MRQVPPFVRVHDPNPDDPPLIWIGRSYVPDATPLLTFGMPVYNEERFLEEALESLLVQTRRDWVLHISDNHSTDGTEAICRQFARRDDRIRYERLETDRGAAFNWNSVLSQATTPLFAWAGGHDRWAPTFVESLVPMLDRPEVILAYPRTQALDSDGNLGRVYEDDHTNEDVEDPGTRFMQIVTKLAVCNMLHGIWRTRALQSVTMRQNLSPDSLLLAELSLIGRYAQHPDLLFYRRQIRAPETTRERVARVLSMVTSKANEAPTGWVHAVQTYLRHHLEVLATSPADLSASRRAALKTRTVVIMTRRHLLNPTLYEILLPRLPAFVAGPLRSAWRRRPGAR